MNAGHTFIKTKTPFRNLQVFCQTFLYMYTFIQQIYDKATSDCVLTMIGKTARPQPCTYCTFSHTCIDPEMDSLSLKISWRFFVPRMFLSVVCANSRVEWWAFSTLATDTVAFDTR